MRWIIKAERVDDDGNQQPTVVLGAIERRAACTNAQNIGVNLQESQQILGKLQDVVVRQQLEEYCARKRKCDSCGKPRPIKDYRRRRLDTVLGT